MWQFVIISLFFWVTKQRAIFFHLNFTAFLWCKTCQNIGFNNTTVKESKCCFSHYKHWSKKSLLALTSWHHHELLDMSHNTIQQSWKKMKPSRKRRTRIKTLLGYFLKDMASVSTLVWFDYLRLRPWRTQIKPHLGAYTLPCPPKNIPINISVPNTYLLRKKTHSQNEYYFGHSDNIYIVCTNG